MTHEFDSLKQWAQFDDAQLRKVATGEGIALLQRVVDLLADENEAARTVTRENFAAVVREMWRLYREGSWQLGEAIIQASEFADVSDYSRAKAVYEQFLAVCRSRFYRDIAQNQLQKLKRKTST